MMSKPININELLRVIGAESKDKLEDTIDKRRYIYRYRKYKNSVF